MMPLPSFRKETRFLAEHCQGMVVLTSLARRAVGYVRSGLSDIANTKPNSTPDSITCFVAAADKTPLAGNAKLFYYRAAKQQHQTVVIARRQRVIKQVCVFPRAGVCFHRSNDSGKIFGSCPCHDRVDRNLLDG